MITQDAFLEEIEQFLESSGMAPTAFGRLSVGDPNLVKDVRDGRSLSLRLVGRVHNFIERANAGRFDVPAPERVA